MSILTVKAPAKINLHLRVKNCRSDGFHELESIFAALDFGDILHFEPCLPFGKIKIDVQALPFVFNDGQEPEQALPPSKNIISRAISLYRERTGFNYGLKINLEKNIPLGGGLGGGSSDAASTLLALNTLAAEASMPGIKPLDAASLDELGAVLGSDVPFFLKKYSAARVSGRGEIIQPLKIPAALRILLVYPGFSSETGEAFRSLDKFRELTPLLVSADKNGHDFASLSNEELNAILAGSPGNWPWFNDFLPVLSQNQTEKIAYQNILERLRELGAEFSGLSGAGSTCFGVFLGETAQKVLENLNFDRFFIKFTFPLEIGAGEV